MLALIIKFIHLVVCFILIVIVLFQADKGEGLAGAFGGGASSTLFGERGAETQISKITTVLAVVFMVTSLIIALWGPSWDKQAAIERYTNSPVTNTSTQNANPMNPQIPFGTNFPMGLPTGGTIVNQTSAPVTTTESAPATTQEANPVVTPVTTTESAPATTQEANPVVTPVTTTESAPAATQEANPVVTPETVTPPVTTTTVESDKPLTNSPVDTNTPVTTPAPVNNIPSVNE
jgi:preprotein translocase subunit SecG